MASTRYLSQRGNQFHFYRRVPSELVEVLGYRFWRESLRTDSRLVAEQRVIAHIHRTNELIEQARRGELRLIPDDVLDDYAIRWSWHYEETVQHTLPEAMLGSRFPDLIRGEPLPDETRNPIFRSRADLEQSVEQFVVFHGINNIVRGGPDWNRLIDLCQDEWVYGNPELQGPHYRGLPPADNSENDRRLTTALRKYSEVNDSLAPRTHQEWSTAVCRFVEVNGDLRVEKIERSHIEKFRNTLKLLPASRRPEVRKLSVSEQVTWAEKNNVPRLQPTTIQKNLTAIRVVLDFAFKWSSMVPTDLRIGWENPCIGIRQRDNRSEPIEVLPFEPDDIEVLFEPERLRKFVRDQHPSRFWLPLLSFYTGARITELAQVTINEVVVQKDLVYLIIHTKEDKKVPGDKKSLKNRYSIRNVPLHDNIIQIGFLDFIERVRTSGHSYMMPDLNHSLERRAGKISSKFGDYKKALGFETREHCFHSFRHGFKVLADRNGVNETLSKLMMGHYVEDVSGRIYGKTSRTRPDVLKAQVVDKISFPALDLEGLAMIAKGLKIPSASRAT